MLAEVTAGDPAPPAKYFDKFQKPTNGFAVDPAGKAVTAGVDSILSVCAIATNPTLKNFGSSLTAFGGLAMCIIPPPVGLAIGGILMLTGGLMSMFGGENPKSPTDIALDEIKDQIKDVDAKVVQLLDMAG